MLQISLMSPLLPPLLLLVSQKFLCLLGLKGSDWAHPDNPGFSKVWAPSVVLE